MTAEVPIGPPEQIVCGSTVTFKQYVSDYLPTDGYTLKYNLVDSTHLISWISTDNRDGYHLFSLSAATTDAYVPGTYKWQSYVQNGSAKYSIGSGTIVLQPNFTEQSSGYDGRSHVKKVLDALESLIEGKASSDVSSYMIMGRRVDKLSPEDLIKWHSHYKALYQQELLEEKAAAGLNLGNKILVRF